MAKTFGVLVLVLLLAAAGGIAYVVARDVAPPMKTVTKPVNHPLLEQRAE